jgi:hypothetical protein
MKQASVAISDVFLKIRTDFEARFGKFSTVAGREGFESLHNRMAS